MAAAASAAVDVPPVDTADMHEKAEGKKEVVW
jgi:hypothetical protein